MAITYNEDGSKKVRNGNKKGVNIAKGFVKRIEDIPFSSEQEINDAINIIDKTSGSRRESRKRKSNLLNDVTGKGFL